MFKYLQPDEWKIIEEGFNAERQRSSESIFSLGNGRMGQRGNFEEHYSGDTLPGNYIAGVYYPDKTRVGWWKQGYPDYYAKVLNAPSWTGINVLVDGEMVDLAKVRVESFRRELNMKEGCLTRICTIILPGNKILQINSLRFLSMALEETGAVRYSVTPVNFKGTLTFVPYIDADVSNEDANYGEKFWTEVQREHIPQGGFLNVRTRKLGFQVCTAMQYHLESDGRKIDVLPVLTERDKYIGHNLNIECEPGREAVLYKFGAVTSSLYHSRESLIDASKKLLSVVTKEGFSLMLQKHKNIWEKIWAGSDISIEGDVPAQQAIRFNIFHLNQTYTGKDAGLNIGPKGFTGEKYGGSTYWDTEAFCFPFYMCTAVQKTARNLLLYRYRHLGKAIENAGKLGFSGGAALYPMVTMNGEECHNEWEITFEEIHRNAAIAFAIFNYVRYTGDSGYYVEGGLEVLIGIARFWARRVNWSDAKKKYVILGVTGPNEYENNVNNNWYTNTMATWCLDYCLEVLEIAGSLYGEKYAAIIRKTRFDSNSEPAAWQKIIDNMYYPVDIQSGIFLQQEGYLDKEQMLVKDLDPTNLPLNRKWSWDRILRSCFIKQADVLQGVYFLEERYDTETIRRNFDFYEPRTVHESSLSPSVHSVIASRTGDVEKAYHLYLRTARLDLDDYNHEVDEGLHITSMAGTWMSIVEGFGGMRVKDGILCFNPLLPSTWKSYSFNIRFRDNLLNINCSAKGVRVMNLEGRDLIISISGKLHKVSGTLTAGKDPE